MVTSLVTSVFIARVLGYTMAVLGLAVLLNAERYQKVIDEMKQNDALTFFMGLFVMVCGLLMVFSHNVWVAGWPVLVTIISWIVFVKGAFYLLLPGLAARMLASSPMGTNLYRVGGLINLAIGIVLIVCGYRAF